MARLAPADVERADRAGARRARALLPVAVVLALVAGLVAADLAGQSNPIGALLLPLVLVPAALWRWPQAGVYIVLVASVVLEQFTYSVGPKPGVFTEHIPLFRSIVNGTGVSPLEILLFLIVLIWLMKRALEKSPPVPRSPLAPAMLVFLLLVVVFLGIGLARHGQVKIALWEVRPWFYMGILYLLGSSLLVKANTFRVMAWIIVLGDGFKAIFGVIVFFQVRHVQPRPEAILAHEASFFFGLYIFLTLGLWLFGVRGRLRVVATLLLPVVVLADMGNSRRVAWAMLGLGIPVMLIVAGARLPRRRRKAARWAGVALVLGSAIYIPAFWNHGGTLGQPARAVHAAIRPNARDLASNQYRVIEDANLVLNIRARNSLGTGFGLPIDYAIPIVNLDNIDSAIAYIPHNGVLWIWMRMGILGEILFWFLVATAVRRCYDLARVGDPESSLLGAFAICAIVAYVVMGYYDMGFFWFRIACCMGFLLGAVEARLRYLRLTPPVASEDGGRHEEGDGGVTEEAMLVLMEASLEATPLATSPPAPGSGPNPVAPPGSRSERGDVKVAPLEAVVSRADRHEPGPGLGTSGSPAAAGGEAAPSSFVTWPRPRSTTPGHYPPGAFKEEPAPHEIPLPDQHPGRHPGGSGDWPTTPVTGRLLAIRVLNYLTNHAVSRVPSFGLRHLWYRRVLGVDLGRGASIQLGCYVWFYGPGQLRRSGLRIGSHTRINRDCCLDARGALVIGDNVSISPEVAILTTQHDYASEDFALDTRTVTIGDHVWIGTRAVVLPGARIGRGAVVAAGAVVSGEVEPMTVVAGVPARPVAKRPTGAANYVLDEPLPFLE